MRFFNTTGPIEPDRHYCVPPLERVKLREIQTLVQRRRYFVLQAPRQTGKTSTLLALKEWLNGQGGCECVYANFEAGQAARDLGLLALAPLLRIANPIYAEVVPRELTWVAQEELAQEAAWYTDAAGELDVVALMESFQAFFHRVEYLESVAIHVWGM